ncbi:MAG TPA: YceI family protein [Solirubrobacteraceae bacterium]|nr:YceI family protein [Solirubrobacteraceae bacterium]
MSEQGAATVADGRYVVDPANSKAGFRARGGWGLFKVPGHFEEFGGEVNVAGGQFTASGKASSSSINTRLGMRDWHLRTGDYLHAKSHPEIGLEVTQGSLAEGRASAQVSVRGKTVPSELRVEVLEAGGDRLRLKAHGEVARKAFGMRPPAFGVGPLIELDLEITAVRSA